MPRWLAPALGRAVADHPVVVLTGARQVGKSTLLEHAEPTRRWKRVTFDDPDAIEQGRRDPAGLWAGADRVVLAEVQRLPAVLSAVKEALDARPGGMRFVLSASADLILMRRVCESLAARAAQLSLLPMASGEMLRRPPPSCLSEILSGRLPREQCSAAAAKDPFCAISRGFMPRFLSLPAAAARTRWWEGYIATCLECDLRDLSQAECPSEFRAVMEVLAARAGQVASPIAASRDAQVSPPRVRRCLRLLEAACLIDRLPAFAGDRPPRPNQAAKLLWVDPALAAHLAGLHDEAALRAAPQARGLFANLVFHHLKVLAGISTPKMRISYWRTAQGQSVDFVLEWGRKTVAVDVKLSDCPRYTDCEGLEAFLRDHPEASGGILIHTGQDILRMGTRIVGLPWTALA
ncbi:MAG: AAA family ATPase [Elusimicrobia bacterium]|nr:AAA family ATPase [Elusimicrobiota bacterium]